MFWVQGLGFRVWVCWWFDVVLLSKPSWHEACEQMRGELKFSALLVICWGSPFCGFSEPLQVKHGFGTNYRVSNIENPLVYMLVPCKPEKMRLLIARLSRRPAQASEKKKTKIWTLNPTRTRRVEGSVEPLSTSMGPDALGSGAESSTIVLLGFRKRSGSGLGLSK